MKLTKELIGKKIRLNYWGSESFVPEYQFTNGDFGGLNHAGDIVVFSTESDNWEFYDIQPNQEVLMSPSVVPLGTNNFVFYTFRSDKPLRVVLKNQFFIGEDGIKRIGVDTEADLWIKYECEK